MFFDNIAEIPKIASKTNASLFVVPDEVEMKIDGALTLTLAKTTISIDEVRELIRRLNVKQLHDVLVLIRPADAFSDESANAFLKALEEPSDKVHFVLVTDAPSNILPTILSRTGVYFWRRKVDFEAPIGADKKVAELAKRLLTAKPKDLPTIADEITKKKDGSRELALEVLGTAIQMLYKTYFINKKEIFLKKLPMFLKTYEAISMNGHIKLHLVADLC